MRSGRKETTCFIWPDELHSRHFRVGDLAIGGQTSQVKLDGGVKNSTGTTVPTKRGTS
jgi:hypothetical protein